MKVLLYGAKAPELQSELAKHGEIEIVRQNPDVVICYGGDGTLLAAELQWPGVPKAPLRNSRRGKRCMAHPHHEVFDRLVKGQLHCNKYIKLQCRLHRHEQDTDDASLIAMNEINVHMAHVNSAVRFTISLNGEPYDDGHEILGDGFVVCTPFGSTAYFKQITRGILYSGLGIGFKFPSEQVNHVVMPEDTVIRARITRGPAVLAFDNSPNYQSLHEGDELIVSKHAQSAILLTWDAMKHPTDSF